MMGASIARAQTKIYTSDIDNYWCAFDSVQQAGSQADRIRLINQLYIDKRTEGLATFMQRRSYSDSLLVYNIQQYPSFWKSIRSSTLIVKQHQQAIEKGIRKLKALYPALKPADIYFTIGGLSSGGTTDKNAVLIGTEILVGTSSTDMSEFEDDFLRNTFKHRTNVDPVFLTIHEYVHTQQKDGYVNVLSQSIREGACDFIATIVTGKPFQTQYSHYGQQNYELVKSSFAKDMFSHKKDRWLYNGSNADIEPDLGYFIGYEICKEYYRKEGSGPQAIKDIIELDYANEDAVEAFLLKSGFFTTIFDKNCLPDVVSIMPFDNEAVGVDTAITEIRITFSRPVEDVSINFSRNGKEHFPLSKIVGYENDNKTLVLATAALIQGQTYDFYITDKTTHSRDGYPFKHEEYKIEFTTK